MYNPTKVTANHGISQTTLTILIGAGILGTLISLTVIYTPGTSQITRRGDALPQPDTAIIDTEHLSTLINKGAYVIQQRCAGCHDIQQRMAGPSWQAIITRYHTNIATPPLNTKELALMKTAVTHPQPGWDGYAPGPIDIPLSADEQLGTAAWILSQSALPKELKGINHELPNY